MKGSHFIGSCSSNSLVDNSIDCRLASNVPPGRTAVPALASSTGSDFDCSTEELNPLLGSRTRVVRNLAKQCCNDNNKDNSKLIITKVKQ